MRFVGSSSEEKRVLYDYTIELSREQGGDSKEYLRDPSLFRDDAKMLLGIGDKRCLSFLLCMHA